MGSPAQNNNMEDFVPLQIDDGGRSALSRSRITVSSPPGGRAGLDGGTPTLLSPVVSEQTPQASTGPLTT